MSGNLFQEYSQKHVQFYDEAFPDCLSLGFVLISDVQSPNIVDLGCGDGRLLFALQQKGFLNGFSEVVGVDLSAERIERVKKELPFVKGIVSDASSVNDLLSSSFDYVICSQVIEHVPDDEALVAEIKRLLRRDGVAFVSSVIKKRYAVYFYYKYGSFRIDPTHVREYPSVDAFVGLFADKELEIVNVSTSQVKFPVIDLFYRLFVSFGLLKPDANFFRKHKLLAALRKLRMPVVGYKTVEVMVKKNV